MKEALIDRQFAVPTNDQATEVLQPGKRAFYRPTTLVTSQFAAVVIFPFLIVLAIRTNQLDASLGQSGPQRRQVIVDVDTQNHFFLNDSPLCVNDHLSVLDNVQKVLTWARNKHVRMISTVQVNNSSAAYINSFLSGGFSIQKPMCTLCRSRILLEAMDCTDLPRRLVEQYDQVILHKRSFDPFAEPRSDRLLTELQADEFIIIGAPTEGAVKATTLGLLARGKCVTVVMDATGPLSLRLAKRALRKMKAKGARLVNADMVTNLTRTVRAIRCN